MRPFLGGCAFLLLSASRLLATELYDSGGLSARLDNTLRYSAAFRLDHADPYLAANPNSGLGDRNFGPGLVSNRLDLLSELDITMGHYGLDASAAGWLDSVYFDHRFAPAVQALHGHDAELLNAFFHGDFDLGGLPASFRIGRHTLLWGESLFFAGNGIAAGQAPIDTIKSASQPLAQAKEVFLPVGQASASLQIASGLAIEAYYQFEWRQDRLNGAGSYLSTANFLDAGGNTLSFDSGAVAMRAADRTPPDGGQYGIALRRSGEVDVGLYALRFNAKDPQFYVAPDQSYYRLIYLSGIELYGASFSGYLGDANLAGEISARRNMPLVANGLGGQAGTVGGGFYTAYAYPVTPTTPTATPQVPTYARGDTLQAQISAVNLFGPTHVWDSASLSAEVSANQRLAVTEGPALLDPTRSRFAASLRTVFAPQFFQVLPGLDLTVPVGVAYNLVGKSSVDSSEVAGTGSLSFGLDAVYRTVWQFSLVYTDFFGPVTRQPLADRGFVVLSIQRSF